MINIAKYSLQLFFDAFKWFLTICTLILFSPIILMITIPIVFVLIMAFSLFLVVLFEFALIAIKIMIYIGIPLFIVWWLLDHYNLI